MRNQFFYKHIFYIALFLGLAVLILWQMLMPGYVLSLDMVFVPEIRVDTTSSGFLNDLPLDFILKIHPSIGVIF